MKISTIELTDTQKQALEQGYKLGKQQSVDNDVISSYSKAKATKLKI